VQACVRSKEYAKILELINLLQLTSSAGEPAKNPGPILENKYFGLWHAEFHPHSLAEFFKCMQ
jgi:hypothetical protein